MKVHIKSRSGSLSDEVINPISFDENADEIDKIEHPIEFPEGGGWREQGLIFEGETGYENEAEYRNQFDDTGCDAREVPPALSESREVESGAPIIEPIEFMGSDAPIIEPIEFTESAGKTKNLSGQQEMEHGRESEKTEPSNESLSVQAAAATAGNPNFVTAAASKAVRCGSSAVQEFGNFTCQVREWRIKLNRQGETMGRDEVVIAVFVQGVYAGEMCLTSREIASVRKKIQEKFPNAQVYTKTKHPDAVLGNVIREQLTESVKRYCFAQAGWNLWMGKHLYIHRGIQLKNALTDADLNLPSLLIEDTSFLVHIFSQMCFLYRDSSISLVMSLFALSGILYRPFEVAGHPIRTALYLVGKSGAYKTAVAKVLYMQLVRESNRGTPRRIDFDTEASLECALASEGTDTVTLLDDVTPGKTDTGRSRIINNLELVLRMVGDGSSKSRSNGKHENVRGAGVHGTVVITGEIMASGLSSNLRCLYLLFEKPSVDLKKLDWFQKNPLLVCTLIAHLTNFVSNQWERIVEMIITKFYDYRIMVSERLVSGRLIDCCAQLNIIADIMREFLLVYCSAAPELVNSFFKNQQGRILDVVARSEKLTDESDPADTFMEALISALENRDFTILNHRFSPSDLDSADGFVDSEHIYILEQRCYIKTTEWLSKGKIHYSFNLKQTERLLSESEYIVTAPNGARKITYCARIAVGKTKVNFLKLRLDKLRVFRLAQDNNSANVNDWSN